MIINLSARVSLGECNPLPPKKITPEKHVRIVI